MLDTRSPETSTKSDLIRDFPVNKKVRQYIQFTWKYKNILRLVEHGSTTNKADTVPQLWNVRRKMR